MGRFTWRGAEWAGRGEWLGWFLLRHRSHGEWAIKGMDVVRIPNIGGMVFKLVGIVNFNEMWLGLFHSCLCSKYFLC